MTQKLKELLRYPEKIPCDKRLHYMIGVVFTALIMIFTDSLLLVSALVIVLAYSIEYVQKWTKSGKFEHWDAIAVILGGLTVMAAMWRSLCL